MALAMRRVPAEDLGALRDDLDVADAEGPDEGAQDVGLLAHRVDEHPPPVRPRKGQDQARHPATRAEIEAPIGARRGVDQRKRRERIQQMEARDGFRLHDPGQVEATVRVEEERDVALDGIGEAGGKGQIAAAKEPLKLDARGARIGLWRIGLGQEKCSFERPFGLPGE